MDWGQIIAIIHEDLKKSVMRSLGVALPAIDDLFHPQNIFEGLETEYQQINFYKDHFGLVVSLLVPIGYDIVIVHREV